MSERESEQLTNERYTHTHTYIYIYIYIYIKYTYIYIDTRARVCVIHMYLDARVYVYTCTSLRLAEGRTRTEVRRDAGRNGERDRGCGARRRKVIAAYRRGLTKGYSLRRGYESTRRVSTHFGMQLPKKAARVHLDARSVSRNLFGT